jgi:hypothetical protein
MMRRRICSHSTGGKKDFSLIFGLPHQQQHSVFESHFSGQQSASGALVCLLTRCGRDHLTMMILLGFEMGRMLRNGFGKNWSRGFHSAFN